MVELCEALVGEQWWQKGTPEALDGSRADDCSLLALFGSVATPAAAASPGTSLRALQALAEGRHGPLCEGTLPAVSGSSC